MTINRVTGVAASAVAALALALVPAGAIGQTACPANGYVRTNQWPIPENRGAAGLSVALQKLRTRASIMMIVAHPDDEDSGALTYLSRVEGARVGLLTLNRGGDGADLMSSQLWNKLALIRTEELLQADRYYCVKQYWSTAQDYGFAKSLKEAERKYGMDHQTVFRSMVRAVRMFRPLVLFSVFVGGPSDGHAAHQFSAKFAEKVYLDAGNPKVFPNQIKEGLKPWTPLKYYARVPFGLTPGHISPRGIYDYATQTWLRPVGIEDYITGKWQPGAVHTNVRVPVGTYIPLDGLTAEQIGAIGHGFHKSQFGGPIVPPAGPAFSDYHLLGSRVASTTHEKSFFQGINVSIGGIADLVGGNPPKFLVQGLSSINQLVTKAIHEFSSEDPSSIAPLLARGSVETEKLIDKVQASDLPAVGKYNVLYELKEKKREFNRALGLSLELSLTATVAPNHPLTGMMAEFMPDPPTFGMAIPGQRFPVKVHLADSGPVTVKIDRISLYLHGGSQRDIQATGATVGKLHGGGVMNVRFRVDIPNDASYTKPYFYQPNPEQPYFNLIDKKYENLPLAPYPLDARVTATYDGATVRLAEVVQTVRKQLGYGFVFNPMPIGPAISVSMLQRFAITPLNRRSFPVRVRLHSDVEKSTHGTLNLRVPAGWRTVPGETSFTLAKDGSDKVLSFRVYPKGITSQKYNIKAIATYNGQEYKEGYTKTGYPGLRPYYLYREATYHTVGTDVTVGHSLNIGYIMGSGDKIPESLENLGLHVHFITNQQLAAGNLSQYNIVVVGIRAYNADPTIRAYNSRLLAYVKQGGVVLVQYQTQFNHDYGPYPYNMTSHPQEVTREHSYVRFIDPASPVLNWPNKITEKDFGGWIEERGSKFAYTWSSRYQTPLETHDPGQPPQKGGLLIARYGKGVWIYTAYAFYRELPFGVPGAYRIFANLVSIPDNPAYFPGK